MKKLALFFLLFTLIYQKSEAKTYRISSQQGFQEIQTLLSPGDVVIILNGSYNNWALDISAKGTKEKPIIIKAENIGKVIFSGDVNQCIFKISGDFITISGITFKACTLNKSTGKLGILIELENSNSCRISNCSFEENVVKAQFMPLVIVGGKGISNQVDSCTFSANVDCQDLQIKVTKATTPLNTLVVHNLFKNKNKVSWKNGNGGECVQVGQDPVLLGTIEAKTTVTQNRFIQCNGENEVISNKSSSNKYLKNYFENNDGELVMRGGHDCTISDNVFKGGTGGIRVNGTGHIITNNRIDGIKTAIRLMYGMAKGKTETGFYIAASGCTIKNNVISNATTGILIGDSKNANWIGKFDTVKYPSRSTQDVAPFDNQITDNVFSKVKIEMLDLTGKE